MNLRDEHPGRDVVVVIPDMVVARWYHALLHSSRGNRLRSLLRLRGGSRVVVVNAPMRLHEWENEGPTSLGRVRASRVVTAASIAQDAESAASTRNS